MKVTKENQESQQYFFLGKQPTIAAQRSQLSQCLQTHDLVAAVNLPAHLCQRRYEQLGAFVVSQKKATVLSRHELSGPEWAIRDLEYCCSVHWREIWPESTHSSSSRPNLSAPCAAGWRPLPAPADGKRLSHRLGASDT